MTRLVLALACALPLLAGCDASDLGFKAVGGLEDLGGAFDTSHTPPHGPDGCPADRPKTAACR